MRKLDIPNIFKSEASDLQAVREKAIKIHGTGDIRAAGNEIEIHIRELFRRMLPKNIYVTHGHLIDENGVISPQLDIIIADTSNLPSLMTTKDGTEYIPIDSVYCYGEIKSTYYKHSQYIEKFSEVLSKIKTEMVHREIPNTAYKAQLNDATLLRDLVMGKSNKILNKIYSFILFVDKGDFTFSDIKGFFNENTKANLPNTSIFLNSGVILYGKINEKGFVNEPYPDEIESEGYHWYYTPFLPINDNSGSLEGNQLGYLYYSIVQHISSSFLEPPNLTSYMSLMMTCRRSLLEY